MSAQVSQLLTGLVDDAAMFPPGSAPLRQAVHAHLEHRAAWYADLVGPLLLPASAIPELAGLPAVEPRVAAQGPITVGLVGDTGVDALPAAVAQLPAGWTHLRQLEVAVAKRGEDPQPGLRRLLTVLRGQSDLLGYAEIPLTWGLLNALDLIAEARAAGIAVAPKFRTGGLAAELFPTPIELAAVLCACRDRKLTFKLTAGLHHALRHIDPETGFAHHGFLNVLSGALEAASGAEVTEVAEALASTDPLPLIERCRWALDGPRPLWDGYGSCSIAEPLADLTRLGLL